MSAARHDPAIVRKAAIWFVRTEVDKRVEAADRAGTRKNGQTLLAREIDAFVKLSDPDANGFTQQAIHQWLKTGRISLDSVYVLLDFAGLSENELVAKYTAARDESAPKSTSTDKKAVPKSPMSRSKTLTTTTDPDAALAAHAATAAAGEWAPIRGLRGDERRRRNEPRKSGSRR